MDENNNSTGIDYERAPAFDVFFDLGKMTMRPGGLGLTRWMLNELQIDEGDDVVELAPGRGATTKIVLKLHPRSYTAVERNKASQRSVLEILRHGELGECVIGTAQKTGLTDNIASVVYGEAMLTMQTNETKLKIASEAFRLLAPGGRYAIHETSLPEDLSDELRAELGNALRDTLRVGARPLSVTEWRELLKEAGFTIKSAKEVPMYLLNPPRIVQDEGLFGAIRFIARVIITPAARRRVWKIRKTLKRYKDSISAVAIVAVKP